MIISGHTRPRARFQRERRVRTTNQQLRISQNWRKTWHVKPMDYDAAFAQLFFLVAITTIAIEGVRRWRRHFLSEVRACCHQSARPPLLRRRALEPAQGKGNWSRASLQLGKDSVGRSFAIWLNINQIRCMNPNLLNPSSEWNNRYHI